MTVAGSALYPLVVESLYTHVTPLPAGPLRQRIEQLAARDGFGDVRVVVSNASSRTTGENAHVSGPRRHPPGRPGRHARRPGPHRPRRRARRSWRTSSATSGTRTSPAAPTIGAVAASGGVLLLSWVLTSAGRRLFRPDSAASA